MPQQWFSKRFPGRLLSTSGNACLVRLIGGPGDGLERLEDHDIFKSIFFIDWSKGEKWEYRKTGKREYTYFPQN